jgi:hypothetical protein
MTERQSQWRRAGHVDGIVISAQSVLHELSFRSPGYTPTVFFGQLLKGWSNVFICCREPTQSPYRRGREATASRSVRALFAVLRLMMSSFDGLLDREVRGLFTPFSPSSCAAASVSLICCIKFLAKSFSQLPEGCGSLQIGRMQPGQIVDLTTGSQEVTL